MTPELTNPPASAEGLDAAPVFVSPEVLRLAAVNLVIGAGALWTASRLPGLPTVVDSFGQVAWQVVMTVLLFVPVAAVLPLQTLLLTRPLIRDVVRNSVAPRVLKLYAVLGVSAGSVLTAVAYGRILSDVLSAA